MDKELSEKALRLFIRNELKKLQREESEEPTSSRKGLAWFLFMRRQHFLSRFGADSCLGRGEGDALSPTPLYSTTSKKVKPKDNCDEAEKPNGPGPGAEPLTNRGDNERPKGPS